MDEENIIYHDVSWRPLPMVWPDDEGRVPSSWLPSSWRDTRIFAVPAARAPLIAAVAKLDDVVFKALEDWMRKHGMMEM